MDSLFASHMLNDNGKQKAKQIGYAFSNLMHELATLCPEGREFSIVKTKLEEASFFAKKAMARDSTNHEDFTEPFQKDESGQ